MIGLSINEMDNWENRKLTNAYVKVVYDKHGIANHSKKNLSIESGPHMCSHWGFKKKSPQAPGAPRRCGERQLRSVAEGG